MTATVNTRAISQWLGQFKSQMPFAVSTAINNTLGAAQVTQRAHDRSVFNVKNPRFVDQSVKIKPFATKARLLGTISVDPPGGQGRASILTQHEDGGEKRPIFGESLWIPEPKGETPIRKILKATGGVPLGSGFRPRELGLKQHGSSGQVWQGPNGIFLIKLPGGGGIVLERTRQGRRGRAQNIRTRKTKWFGTRSTTRILYSLTSHGHIEPRLKFRETVTRAIQEHWAPEIIAALTQALRTAR